ncbi:TetR/AcrR family transcriptional regulator [Flexivirga meconopsidis]|uniref:TetR/AcrR family transcriptional regulator n=1 Tax=Flexivirga meconopsidis TaxID=2977121 RepID=UPI00224086C0|nr:TetR family transcriptional regulator [Flexivirga meconopsidis]
MTAASPAPDDAPRVTGHSRRKARTRAALLRAGQELLIEGRSEVSIEEITGRAQVGFGSFFNHFPGGKDELFRESVMTLLDAYSAWIGSATEDLTDPAEIFARSFRLTGRLAMSEPELLAPLLATGTRVLAVRRGLRERALDDISRGVSEGRFIQQDPEVLLMTVGGVLLGLVQLVSDPDSKAEEAVIDQVTASSLRLLGLTAEEAEEIVTHPLPDLAALEQWS